MHSLPTAQLCFVDREPGLTRFEVLCPYCNQIHHHQHLNRHRSFDVTSPCSTGTAVRRYRVELDQVSAGQGRDDNAIDVPVPNWEE